MEYIEFTALTVIGISSTVFLYGYAVIPLKFDVLQAGYNILDEIYDNFAGRILFTNTLLQTLALYTCFYIDTNRDVLRSVTSRVILIASPVILFVLGPCIVIPLQAYRISKEYRLVTRKEYITKGNAPSFSRSFYLLLAILALIYSGIFKLDVEEGKHVNPSWSRVFIAVPFVFSLVTAIDIAAETTRDRGSASFGRDSSEIKYSHYIALACSGICLLVGFVVHLTSLMSIISSYDEFIFYSTQGKINSLCLLHYIITVATSYLWLDHHSTTIFGPIHPANQEPGGILSFKDLCFLVLLGPSLHFGIAAMNREAQLMAQNHYKKRYAGKE